LPDNDALSSSTVTHLSGGGMLIMGEAHMNGNRKYKDTSLNFPPFSWEPETTLKHKSSVWK
jgi:hypothetical protein